ncbi:MAG: hypothetical protein ACE5GA_00975 [Candidatus Zixiibacteriota bacterium]
MSYTTVEITRRQIMTPGAPGTPERSVRASFTGAEWVQISPDRIISGSVTVKAVNGVAPVTESATFVNAAIVTGAKPLAPDSLTVAGDSSLGTIYSEGIDYVVDCASGVITRAMTGAIPAGSTVQLWYFPFTVYVDGVDYSVDHADGRVRRITSGAILSGGRVIVDFTPELAGISDEVFNEAVSEANQRVSAAVDPGGNFGANLILQTAATYLAASIICRIAATASLVSDSQGKNAALWLEIARSFAGDANALLHEFRPPTAALSGPKRG